MWVSVTEELGDYDEVIHIGDYVSSLDLALRQTDNLEKKIIELHKNVSLTKIHRWLWMSLWASHVD